VAAILASSSDPPFWFAGGASLAVGAMVGGSPFGIKSRLARLGFASAD
jgi:hypothetical protein